MSEHRKKIRKPALCKPKAFSVQKEFLLSRRAKWIGIDIPDSADLKSNSPNRFSLSDVTVEASSVGFRDEVESVDVAVLDVMSTVLGLAGCTSSFEIGLPDFSLTKFEWYVIY